MFNFRSVFYLIAGWVCILFYNNCGKAFQPTYEGEAASSEQINQTPSQEEPTGPDSPNPPGNNADGTDNNQTPTNPQYPHGGPAILAAGHFQSTMYSCDGGKSWEGYQSTTDTRRCYDRNADDFDCNHSEGAPIGVAWGKEAGFMVTFGWGQPGQVVRSKDGNTWTQVHQGSTFAGVSYGNGHYYLNARRNNLISSDGGDNWTTGNGAATTPYNQRKTFFTPGGGGRFLTLASSGDVVDLMISKDNGLNFEHPTTLPAGCGNGSFAVGNQSIIILSQNTCMSLDHGDTWIPSPALDGVDSIVFNGSEFRAYGRGFFMRSPDGETNWERVEVTLDGENSNPYLNHVVYQKDLKRYSATSQRWQNWYESTEFYWSDDGVNWHTVEADKAPTAPHPIRAIGTGYLESCSR